MFGLVGQLYRRSELLLEDGFVFVSDHVVYSPFSGWLDVYSRYEKLKQTLQP